LNRAAFFSEVKDLLFVFRQIRHKCLVILNGAAFRGPQRQVFVAGVVERSEGPAFVFRLTRHKCIVILNGAAFFSEVKDPLLHFSGDGLSPSS